MSSGNERAKLIISSCFTHPINLIIPRIFLRLFLSWTWTFASGRPPWDVTFFFLNIFAGAPVLWFGLVFCLGSPLGVPWAPVFGSSACSSGPPSWDRWTLSFASSLLFPSVLRFRFSSFLVLAPLVLLWSMADWFVDFHGTLLFSFLFFPNFPDSEKAQLSRVAASFRYLHKWPTTTYHVPLYFTFWIKDRPSKSRTPLYLFH